jgi:hypothetical protein
MSQKESGDPVLEEFTVPAWTRDYASWDDFRRAVERAYAQHRERRRPDVEASPPPPPPPPDPDDLASHPDRDESGP